MPCSSSKLSSDRVGGADLSRPRGETGPVPDWRLWLASACVSAIASVALGVLVDRHAGLRVFFVEDGPVEMLQAGLLFLIACVFTLAFVRSAGARALVCLVAAYACIFALTREVPRCGSAFAGGDVCLTAGWKRTIVLLGSAAALIALVLRPIDWPRALRPSRLLWTWPCLLVVGLLALAEVLESFIYYSEIEEFLELLAYLHLGVFALGTLFQTRLNDPERSIDGALRKGPER